MTYFLSLLNQGALFGTLAAIQVLLLNRLGLAFAAIPAFAGIGAYLLVVTPVNPFFALFFLLTGGGLTLLMAHLGSRLRHDFYLLATLAVLECLGGIIGAIPSLGGREGLSFLDGNYVGGPGYELEMIWWSMGLFLMTLFILRWLLQSPLGLAIDRIEEHPESAVRWFPANRFRFLLIITCCSLGLISGLVYGYYHGHIGPQVFSIDKAILVLMFSIMAMRWPELAGLAALLYWVLPFFITELIGGSTGKVGEIIRLIWGSMLICSIFWPSYLKERNKARVG